MFSLPYYRVIPWDVPKLRNAYSRLTIIKNTDVLQQEIPRTGNNHKRENVVSKHSRDITYYKITSIIYMSRQLLQ